MLSVSGEDCTRPNFFLNLNLQVLNTCMRELFFTSFLFKNNSLLKSLAVDTRVVVSLHTV
jgi:hypothetical protein